MLSLCKYYLNYYPLKRKNYDIFALPYMEQDMQSSHRMLRYRPHCCGRHSSLYRTLEAMPLAWFEMFSL